MNLTEKAKANVAHLQGFIGRSQLRALIAGLKGEERNHFLSLIAEYGERIAGMPKTYEQDGLGMQAIAYLHYFAGSCDWYITERDMEAEQLQAFGLANLGYGGGELGYISIVELLKANVELDLYFTPKTLAVIQSKEVTA